MPFKEIRANKFIKLKQILDFCKSENITYCPLNKKDYFTSLASAKQTKKLEKEILAQILKLPVL